MKTKLYTAMLVLCMSIVGCKKEPLPEPTPAPVPEPQKQEFVATLANPITKTTVTDAGKVSWESTDAIAVFDSGKSAPVKATIKSINSDGKTAVFVPASEIASPVGAVYPYDASATLSNNVVSISLGGTQSGAFADANIAASKADGYNLSFQNVTSVFKFKITDENVKSVKLSATGVGGTLNITLGSPVSSALSGTSTIDEIMVSNITSGTDYYITIAPGSYADLQFSWYDSTGAELGSSSLGESTTVNAGTIYTWGELTEHKDEAEFVQFEDENFKAYCVENFDTDGDGEISLEEALEVTEMIVDTEVVGSLVGVEYFTNLIFLACWPSSLVADNSKLTTLDVSKNTALTQLVCNHNQLTSLNVSGCSTLTNLYCNNNQLTTLDVSKNIALTDLVCRENQLTTLDVSKNIALTDLDCWVNQLTTLDVSKNTALTHLVCPYNQLVTLDVSKNTALTSLDCCFNQLTSLNVSGCSTLTDLGCIGNQLASLDVSKNTVLTQFNCVRNQLTSLDVSNNTALTNLQCSENQLTTLDVSKNTALTQLGCARNQLTSLDVSNNTALTSLSCDYNSLSTLDVSKNTALTQLGCARNQLTSLDVSNNTALTSLSCDYNSLSTLDVSKNTALTNLYCSSNQLSTLDVSNNTALRSLHCFNNQLTTLDVSNNTALTLLWCYNNQIPYIYVWNGFVESEHTEWSKDSSAEYVVKGAGVGGIDDYSVEDIWGNSGSTPGENDRNANGHEYVDLGLSVNWATCNVGATVPEGYGDYFAWGDPELYYTEESSLPSSPVWKNGKTGGYNWNNYKYGSSTALSKYNSVDNKSVLETCDDIASENWGGDWRMPTKDEIEELLSSCDWKWISKNGISGYEVSGNGNSIFLPAASSADDTGFGTPGMGGYYWSSSLSENNIQNAADLLFHSGGKECYVSQRNYACSVRAVIK